MKIAILPSMTTQNNVLSPSHIEQLEAMGTVVRFEGATPPTSMQVIELLKGAEIAVTSWGCPPIDEEVLKHATELKLVIHAAGTVKGVVTPELWKKDIRVSSGNEHLAIGVGDTALGMTIASLKNMWRLTEVTRRGGWNEGREQVRELYDLTIGVIGAGKAGRRYISLVQNFDVRIVLFDPVLTAEQAKEIGVEKMELNELLAVSDVVSIHAPSIPATDNMFNAHTLSIMKDDAILINTARGSIVDEKALYEELKKGRLFACLDVTVPEPPAVDDPLRSLPNCVITPHIAGSVTNGLRRLGQFTVNEVRSYITGTALEGEVYEQQMAVLA